jgi:hypothetical protein
MTAKKLLIGWASADITPEGPVEIQGQFHVRVSEGVRDPLTATVLVLDSVDEQAVMVSCDLVAISDAILDGVREAVGERVSGLDPSKIFLNATHTHTGPVVVDGLWSECPVDLDVMKPETWRNFAIERIARAIADAWEGRAPGGISYGLGQAVVGHNRRWVNRDGVSRMYGNTNDPAFSHIEGYEDHAVNLLFTWSEDKALTGMVVNLACTSQETEGLFEISADFWHETRCEIRKRHGESLFILPQCSAAGDQSPHHIFRKAAEERMLKLAGRTSREEIALRIANAVDEVLPHVSEAIENALPLEHITETVSLSRRRVTEEDVAEAATEGAIWQAKYEEIRLELESNPALRDEPHWYVPITMAWRRSRWYGQVAERYELQKSDPTISVEMHVIRVGDIVFATNPFEYYLDFGMRILVRSKAVQTFLVQLTGNKTYVPSERTVAGKGYGTVASSTLIGPKGGDQFAERTIELIHSLWPIE